MFKHIALDFSVISAFCTDVACRYFVLKLCFGSRCEVNLDQRFLAFSLQMLGHYLLGQLCGNWKNWLLFLYRCTQLSSTEALLWCRPFAQSSISASSNNFFRTLGLMAGLIWSLLVWFKGLGFESLAARLFLCEIMPYPPMDLINCLWWYWSWYFSHYWKYYLSIKMRH